MKNRTCGLTLAEVLIPPGIIGVVAAMTLPNLFAKIDHAQKISLLKKSTFSHESNSKISKR